MIFALEDGALSITITASTLVDFDNHITKEFLSAIRAIESTALETPSSLVFNRIGMTDKYQLKLILMSGKKWDYTLRTPFSDNGLFSLLITGEWNFGVIESITRFRKATIALLNEFNISEFLITWE